MSTSCPSLRNRAKRGVVALHRLAVTSQAQKDMAQRAQALGPRPVVVDLFGQPSGGMREAIGLLHVDARQPHDAFVHLLHQCRGPEVSVLPERPRARLPVREPGELPDEIHPNRPSLLVQSRTAPDARSGFEAGDRASGAAGRRGRGCRCRSAAGRAPPRRRRCRSHETARGPRS